MAGKSKNPVKINDVFGRLTVIGKTVKVVKANDKKSGFKNSSASLCKCNCGKELIVRDQNFFDKLKPTRSCGCYKSDFARERQKVLAVTHGMSKTSIYNIWSKMKDRCSNPNNKKYKDYGGRGITICDKWQNFEGFLEDMGETYQYGLSIDRINNNGIYCKENCRWATDKQQANNSRNNVVWLYEGQWITSQKLADIFGIKVTSLYEKKYLDQYPKRKLYEDNEQQ